MAKGKKSFVLYADIKHTFEELTDEQAGKLIKHIISYVNDEDPQTDDFVIRLAFAPIKQQLKRDLKKYEERAERSRNNGKKGGRKKNPKEPSGFQNNPDEPKEPDSGNDNDSVSGNDNVTVNDKSKVYDQAVHNTCKVCLRYFPEHLHPKNQSQKNNWLDTVNKLHRIDGIPYDTICEIVKWAREDEFWSGNFLSITKLRKKNKDQIPYIVVFNEKIKSNGTKKSRRQQITEHNRRTAEELGLL